MTLTSTPILAAALRPAGRRGARGRPRGLRGVPGGGAGGVARERRDGVEAVGLEEHHCGCDRVIQTPAILLRHDQVFCVESVF